MGIFLLLMIFFFQASIANFGMEFILSFLVAYVFFSVTPSTSASGRRTSPPAEPFSTSLTIGIAYLTALTAYRGSLNPARALGPAFVADGWDYHWVFWVGPILGACCGAFCYTFIFNLKKPKWAETEHSRRRGIGGKDMEVGSMKSEEDMIDDLERVRQFKSNMIATYNDGLTGLDSVYNTSVKPYKRQHMAGAGAESVYGGTKSMYNGGPPMYNEDRGNMVTNGRRTPGLETKSMYGGLDDVKSMNQSRAQLKRSLSVHSKIQRRNPQDHLPEEPPLGDCVSNMAVASSAASSRAISRQQQQQQNAVAAMQLSEVSQYARKFSSSGSGSGNEYGDRSVQESMYREYIKQKNAEADAACSPMEQLSGSSSGQCSGASSSGYYSSSKDEQRGGAALLKEQQFHRQQASMCSTRGSQFRRAGHSGGIEVVVPPPPIIGEGGGLRAQNYTPSTASSFGY